MSRFSDDYDGADYDNAGELWHANVQRALHGRRGQKALRELEEALLALPEPKLIEGHLALQEGGVCAVGALIVHRRTRKGEERATVLAELEQITPPMCTCWHRRDSHESGTGTCTRCHEEPRRYYRGGRDGPCAAFEYDPESSDGGDYETAAAGKEQAGLTFTLAWRIAQLNDDDLRGVTPEERWQRVLDWTRRHLQAVAA